MSTAGAKQTPQQARKCANCGNTSPNMKVCGGCGKFRYCSRECQKQHWKTHKNECGSRNQQAEDVEVQYEDQLKINQFGRLNQRRAVLRAQIQKNQDLLANLQDVISELEMLIEDDAVRLLVGDAYFHVEPDFTQEYTEGEQKRVQAEIDASNEELNSIETTMKQLKVELYAKFGNNINLEE